MGCVSGNNLLQRFRVRIKIDRGDLGSAFNPFVSGFFVFNQITKISGLSLGEIGIEEMLEQGKRVKVTDGIVAYPTLSFQARMYDRNGLLVPEILRAWWQKRDEVTASIFVDITTRNWCPIYTLGFYGSTIKSLSFPDQEMGQSQVGYVDASFEPVEMDFVDLGIQNLTSLRV